MARNLNSSKTLVARYSTELAVCIAILWLMAGAILGSRLQNVFLYDTIPTLPPSLELFGAPNSVLVVLTFTCLSAVAILLIRHFPSSLDHKPAARSMRSETVNAGSTIEASVGSVILWGGLSTLPVWLCIARSIVPDAIIQPSVWEVIWFAFASSRAAYYLAVYFSSLRPSRDTASSTATNTTRYSSVMIAICVLATVWWFSQSLNYYQSFRLGYQPSGITSIPVCCYWSRCGSFGPVFIWYSWSRPFHLRYPLGYFTPSPSRRGRLRQILWYGEVYGCCIPVLAR